MKKLSLIVLAAVLSAAALTGCSAGKSSGASESSAAGSAASAVESKAETTAAPTEEPTEAETTSAKKEEVVYNENGLKVTYLGYDESNLFPQFNYLLENNSNKSYSIMSEDESINDRMITMGLFETIAPGKKSTVSMTVMQSDLEKNGIDKIQKVEFKLHYSNADDFMETYDSDVIVINNP